jgi:branched-chain amino acid transport system permease protein
MLEFLQYCVSGVAVGSIYALVALGLVLILKATDIFNFAQGDMVMLGAYLGLAGIDLLHLPVLLAAVLAVVVAALLGLGLQALVLRPMLGQPLLTMVMVTIAISLVIRSVVVVIWGPVERSYPSTLPNHVVDLGGLKVSTIDLSIMAIAVACMLVFAIFFKRSRIGLQMRATAESGEAAAVCGIDEGRIFTLAMIIGVSVAALGGILLANLQVVSPGMAEIGLLALPAAIVGGITSISGAVAGGLLIGVLGQLSTGYLSSDASDAVVYGVVLLVLLIRPYGLFGQREVVRV